MSEDLTATDLFCGKGGSSAGASQIRGVKVRMAANHWPLAVETHAANHPEADHACANISETNPRFFPKTDLAWMSPECTNHSQAKGRKKNIDYTPDLFGDRLPDEAAIRSRATMWDVPRFAEVHGYRAIIVENVVDVRDWIMFPAWLHAMTCLGYEHKAVYLNSMHAHALGAPAPQSRDRVYFVFWKKGERRPDFDRWTRPLAYCPSCDEAVRAIQSWKKPDKQWGKYRTQYVYRCPSVKCRHRIVEPITLPAATAIDWTLPGQVIGERAKPLAAKTLARIQAGLEKFGPRWLAGLGVPCEGRDGKQSFPLDQPWRTMTTRNETGVAFPPAFLMRHYTPRGQLQQMCTDVDAVMPTQTASSVPALIEAPALGYVMRNNEGGAEMCTGFDDVLRTITTKGHQSIIQAPAAFLAELRGGGSVARDVIDPMATVTASGNHHMLVSYYGNGGASGMGDPIPTVTTKDRHALVGASTQLRIPSVEECSYRMLEPHEVDAAMAFDRDYIALGNKRERVKMSGNAVTPPSARDLFGMVVEAVTGETVELAA